MDAIPPPLERAKECANVRLVKGDVRSSDLLRYVLQSECIDTVMHFLAQSHVDNSFGNSYDFTKNISDCLIHSSSLHFLGSARWSVLGGPCERGNERTNVSYRRVCANRSKSVEATRRAR